MQSILDNVNIFINSAASIDFDTRLDIILENNAFGRNLNYMYILMKMQAP